MYYYIDNLNLKNIEKFPKNISLILRKYNENLNIKKILQIKNKCKKNAIKLFLSNNIKLAIKLDLDGAYIPSFNKDYYHNNFCFKTKFTLLGSAHSLKEIRIKETQKVAKIFISPIFKINKHNNYLGIYNFTKLNKLTTKETVCLGGINNNNVRKLNILKIKNFAGISFFEKNFL